MNRATDQRHFIHHVIQADKERDAAQAELRELRAKHIITCNTLQAREESLQTAHEYTDHLRTQRDAAQAELARIRGELDILMRDWELDGEIVHPAEVRAILGPEQNRAPAGGADDQA